MVVAGHVGVGDAGVAGGPVRLANVGLYGNTTTSAVSLTAGSVSVSVSAIGATAGGSGAVDSVNGQTGTVVLDPDDLDDTSTTNKFATAAELSKLAGIAAGAEVNVQSDWDAVSGDALILNKPTLGTAAAADADDFDAAGSAATVAGNLTAHLNDTSDAHDASAISFAATGTIAGTDVQTAVAEVATDAASALSAHEADTTSVHGIADTSVLLVDGDIGTTVQAHSAVLDATTASFLIADETKLDGIEALADVTDATNVAAAGALMKVAGGASVENIGAVESNVLTVAATGSTETLDTSTYGVFDCTMDQACTFTFGSPAPSGKATVFVLILRGAFTPTFPAAVDWGDATPPTYTTPSVFVFTTIDAGTTWLGQLVGKAFG